MVNKNFRLKVSSRSWSTPTKDLANPILGGVGITISTVPILDSEPVISLMV